MTQFIVHLYPVIRMKLKKPVEASSYEEAVIKAEQGLRVRDYVDAVTGYDEVEIEDAEECNYALVDVAGDPDYTNSRWVHMSPGAVFGDRAIRALRELMRTSKNLHDNHGPVSEYVKAMEEAGEVLEQIDLETKLQRQPPPVKINTPCPHCGREEHDDYKPLGFWWTPCPSDDCPSHEEKEKP